MSEAPPPFVIFATPRSRTFWTARFLSYGGWYCGHDQIIHCRSLDDVKSWLAQPFTGTVETAGAPFWRLLRHYRPDARVAVIRRPVEEVVASFMAKGWPDADALRRLLTRLDHKLDQILQRNADVFCATYESMQHEHVCAGLFQHCLPGMAHDHAWWSFIAPQNLQLDLSVMVRYFAAHNAQIVQFAKIARHRTIALMRPADGDYNDGVTFQVEPFEDFYRDGQEMFAEHLVQVGEAPEAYLCKNIPLYRRLDALGALQCLTARSNGRIFGYLVSIIAPSLDDPSINEAHHTLFFASPSVRNLGMRLQRAALEPLKERGAGQLFLRAGIRGSGPRLGTLYRRLGAERFGEMYRLDLEAA